jgi:hypothetical protein
MNMQTFGCSFLLLEKLRKTTNKHDSPAGTSTYTKVMAEYLALLPCIREVLGSDLLAETGYLGDISVILVNRVARSV